MKLGEISQGSRQSTPISSAPVPDCGPYYVEGHDGVFDRWDAAKATSEQIESQELQRQMAHRAAQQGRGW